MRKPAGSLAVVQLGGGHGGRGEQRHHRHVCLGQGLNVTCGHAKTFDPDGRSSVFLLSAVSG